MKKVLLIALGSISLGLGVAGIFLPLLPTTPFLLLASVCYMRSSQRLYDWLTQHKRLGPPITNYLKHRAVSRKTKIYTIVLLWVSLAVSIYFVPILWVRILLGVIGAAVTVHLLRMKTLKEDTGVKDE